MDNKCKNTQKDPLASKNVIIVIIIVSLVKITHCSIFELHTAHSFGYRRLRYDRRATLTSKAVLRSFGSPGGGEEEEEEEMSMWRFCRRLFRRELRRRRWRRLIFDLWLMQTPRGDRLEIFWFVWRWTGGRARIRGCWRRCRRR